jgi:hypothetical protein
MGNVIAPSNAPRILRSEKIEVTPDADNARYTVSKPAKGEGAMAPSLNHLFEYGVGACAVISGTTPTMPNAARQR